MGIVIKKYVKAHKPNMNPLVRANIVFIT